MDWTPGRVAELRGLAGLGASKRGVARKLGLSVSTVLRVSRAHGIEFRPVRGRPSAPDALRSRWAVLLPGLKERLLRDLGRSPEEVQDEPDACDTQKYDDTNGADIA